MSRAVPLTDVTAVIFDMDGVLVDSEPTNFEAMLRLLERYGIAYTEADDRRFRGRRNLDLYAHLRQSYPGLPGDAELEDELTALTLGSIRRRCAPMPGVPDVLESTRRRGYRLALASSAVPAVIAANLAALGVFSLFETIVSGVEVASGKPAPDIFLEAARRLAVPNERCLVVEDSRNGVLAARAAGMACVAVPCPATRDEDFREATLRLEALPALLGLLPQRPSTSVPSGKSC